MERHQGQYALIQFCPVPERQEYLNIGLLLVVPERGFFGVRLAQGQSRIEKLFGKQPKSYFNAIKDSFESRLRLELERDPRGVSLGDFSRKRANEVRLSALMPVAVGMPEESLEALFMELVGDDAAAPREPRMRKKLRDAFIRNKVEQYLEVPSEIDLPEVGLKVHVPYAYKNGCYNLIDAMRLPPSGSEALREAGKRALEGNLIWKHFEHSDHCKRLVVVGDFSHQSSGFYSAMRDQFRKSHVGLYSFDDLNPLFSDIITNAREHGKIHS